MNGYDDEDFARAMKSKGPKGLKLEVGARRAPRLLF